MPLYTLTGQVVPGKRLGSKLGFPTANIAYNPAGRDWPREGVYIAVAEVAGEGRGYVAILNQGRHPTTPEGQPTVEAHLLGHPGQDLYGRQLSLSYMAYLRPEIAFPHLDALREQLTRDRVSALIWAQTNAPHLLEGLDASLLPHHP